MKIEQNGNVSWGWLGRGSVALFASAFVAFAGFLFHDRMLFQERLVKVEEATIVLKDMARTEREQHDELARRADVDNLKQTIDDLKKAIERLEESYFQGGRR